MIFQLNNLYHKCAIIIFGNLLLSSLLSRCRDLNYDDYNVTDNIIFSNFEQTNKITNTISYGVDVSYPMHHDIVSDNYAWLPHNTDPEHNDIPLRYIGMPIQPMSDRLKEYEKLLNGCRKYYGISRTSCDHTERDRIKMSLKQPPSMMNYSDIGFKKIRAPLKLRKLIGSFWNKNKDIKYINRERWNKGNTYTNHWHSPTYMLSVEDVKLRGAGQVLKMSLWNAARQTIEDWTDNDLGSCSLYGVRVYTRGSILATHVDRMPLITSAIVNVAQDVDVPWPIEVIGHDGKAHNITMGPGDMILYESHSVLHGRPFSMKGRFFANIFIHFKPVGYRKSREYINVTKNIDNKNKMLSRYKQAIKERRSGVDSDQGLYAYNF